MKLKTIALLIFATVARVALAGPPPGGHIFVAQPAMATLGPGSPHVIVQPASTFKPIQAKSAGPGPGLGGHPYNIHIGK